MLKIAVIGGGSSYTPEIIEGFIQRHHELPVKELWLVDIEAGQEKLNIVGNLAKRMVEKAGIDCTVHLTLNREEALKDANFVTTQLRVGLLDARIVDERIPLAHGMLGQETNGVGGFAKALRTVPVILDIAKDMERLCPHAFLINFTNPASIVTEAVQRFTSIKAIGLCNVPVNMRKAVGKILDSDDFLFQAVGLNHYVFGQSVYYDGRDVMPEVLPKLLEDSEFNPKNIEDIPYHSEQILELGLMPCYYHKYYYMADDMLAHALHDFETIGTRGQVVKAVEKELFEVYRNVDLKEKPVEIEKRGGSYYSEAACELINGIYNNKQDHMIVNVRNGRTLPFLPEDAVIECTSLITDAGPLPMSFKPLPIQVESELHLLKAYERLTIEAAIEGNYNKALQALTLHPLVKKGQILKQVLDEVLEANKDYLPQFHR